MGSKWVTWVFHGSSEFLNGNYKRKLSIIGFSWQFWVISLLPICPS